MHHTGPWASTRLHIKQVHYLQQTGHTNSKRLCTFHDGRKLKAKMKKGNTNLWRRGDTVKVRSQLGHDLSEVYIVRVRNWGSTGTTFDGLQLTFAMCHNYQPQQLHRPYLFRRRLWPFPVSRRPHQWLVLSFHVRCGHPVWQLLLHLLQRSIATLNNCLVKYNNVTFIGVENMMAMSLNSHFFFLFLVIFDNVKESWD